LHCFVNERTMLNTVIEVAEQLGCSAQYVRKLLREGRLNGQMVGDTWVIASEDVDNFDKKDLRIKPNLVADRKSKRQLLKSKLNCLSFFSGAMGLDLGLESVGINVLLACEIDNASRQTISHNDKKVGLIGDIRDYSVEEILEYANVKNKEDVDIIVGGPPCQAFSTAGKRQGFQDERGNVFLKFIDLITTVRPKYAVIENVRGLMSSILSIDIDDEIIKEYPIDWKNTKGSSLFYVKKKLEKEGYKVSFNLYNSANYGSPQVRERVVIICTKLPNKVEYLEPTNSNDELFGLPKWKTFKDAVIGLDGKKVTSIQFSEKRLQYIKMLKAGENWRNLPLEIQPIAMGQSFNLGGGKTGFFRRLAWNKPAPTVVTHPAMPATELAHPVENRPLSVEEYKRIQEFPDSWEIQGAILEQYKQIGNAVPVGLGRAIGNAIINHHKGKKVKIYNGFSFSRYNYTSEIEFEKEILKLKKVDTPKLQRELNFG
jgi:DNA (cytosine-5)-methyltransferase 1